MTRPLRVAVRLTGGLGDVLMASPLVHALGDALGDATIVPHYHTRPIAEFVFAGARWINAIAGHDELVTRGKWAPDLLVHTGHFPRYVFVGDEPTVRRLAPQAFRDALDHNAREIASIDGLVKAHPKLDGFWARMWARNGRNYLDGIGHISGLPVNRHTWPVLNLDPVDNRHGMAPGSYVTIHDGFDTRQAPAAGRATKCWPIEHWETLVHHLRTVLPPDVAIVQVGAGKSRVIKGVDTHFVNRTSLAECAWILKGSRLHIDTDSGIAHLAHVLHTPAVVMFGPTNASYYGHATNVNVGPGTCGDCWWSTPDWLAKCPRGLANPVCMDSITPYDVALEAAKRLGDRPPALFQPIAERARAFGHPHVFRASPVTVYPEVCDYKVEADAMVSAVGLTPAPVSEHITSVSSGAYVHASKQWEYVYAWRAIREHLNARVSPHDSPAAEWLSRSSVRVADVGGGRGAFAAFLASQGMDVTQFDRDYLWGGDPLTERNYRSWAQGKGYSARFGSIYNLPATSGDFDVVLCVSVIEHLVEKQTALSELLRLVRPGGICVLTFDLALTPERFKDRFRVGVASLDNVVEWFGTAVAPTTDDVVASAQRIQADRVLGIPDGMTVAGITLTRN